ncbi:MAG: molybdopterin molybdenumtransferase MoeA [Anaerolineaceae bacterium]|nr:molybdopterin molybdenumtransferase MoeA [Anaerolineaceae bacterium]
MPIPPKEALRIVLEKVRPLQLVTSPLAEAVGYCLARDVRADRDLPPTDRSAMDGYAVRSVDVRRCPCRLEVVGEVSAGSGDRPTVGRGQCSGILTGAVVPPGTDAVVKVEETREADGFVNILRPARRGLNIRRRAENAPKGTVVLPKGTVLGPAQIGLAAMVGLTTVKVRRMPTVAVLSTGRELRAAGQKVRPCQLRDGNGPSLVAALGIAGCRDTVCRIVPDDPDVLVEELAAALAAHDLVVITGGVSVGKYDFVPQAIRRCGARVRFHGVAIKPGKPQLYATLRGNRHLFGLPGNPLSALAGFHLFVLPALRRLMGVDANRCRPFVSLPLTRGVRVSRKRTELVLARLAWGRGAKGLVPLTSNGSADLVSAADADGVFLLPGDVRQIPKGALVEFIPWRPIL